MATDNKQLVLDNLRKDLVFQLETAEDLDWNYFVETALKAKLIADNANVNMVEHERSIEEIISDAKSFTEEFVTSGMMPGGNLKRTILKYGL